jgi:hypothetical protein
MMQAIVTGRRLQRAEWVSTSHLRFLRALTGTLSYNRLTWCRLHAQGLLGRR